jgi:two-component system phosphate regulon response regulator PhoB
MNGHILIVENEDDIADVIKRYLEFEGFAVRCAGTYAAARAACVSARPEMVLLDWRLPDRDGDELVGDLRASAETAHIPIIMMTGGYPTATLTTLLASERIPLLIKPFSLDQLVASIKSMTSRERAIGVA